MNVSYLSWWFWANSIIKTIEEATHQTVQGNGCQLFWFHRRFGGPGRFTWRCVIATPTSWSWNVWCLINALLKPNIGSFQVVNWIERHNSTLWSPTLRCYGSPRWTQTAETTLFAPAIGWMGSWMACFGCKYTRTTVIQSKSLQNSSSTFWSVLRMMMTADRIPKTQKYTNDLHRTSHILLAAKIPSIHQDACPSLLHTITRPLDWIWSMLHKRKDVWSFV